MLRFGGVSRDMMPLYHCRKAGQTSSPQSYSKPEFKTSQRLQRRLFLAPLAQVPKARVREGQPYWKLKGDCVGAPEENQLLAPIDSSLPPLTETIPLWLTKAFVNAAMLAEPVTWTP
jgi:hypothetical protein